MNLHWPTKLSTHGTTAYRALILLMLLAYSKPATSLAQGFRITDVTRLDGRVVVHHESATEFYHVLQRVDLKTGAATPIALEPGAPNIGSIEDPNPPSASGYYRVVRVRNDNPGDIDNDGIDDLYEQSHPPLDPFNSKDAGSTSPVTGRTYSDDYLRDGSNLVLYPYLVGRGMHDVTGPAADGGMMGYAESKQKSAGLHDRQWARAFVVAGRQPGDKNVAFVVVETGQLFHSITQGVIDLINADDELKDYYSADNIVLSATHTHGGAGGHSHHVLYNISIGGFAWQTYDAMVHGIYMAIKKAHRDLAPGRISLNEGNLDDANENRQVNAFLQNPEITQPELGNPFGNDNRDTKMVCLRFEHVNHDEIGMFNWFPVHGVSFSKENRLLTSDNKGLAAYLFEKQMGTYYPGHGSYAKSSGFVAGFANSNPGDMTANRRTLEPGWPTNGENDAWRADQIGTRQYEKALSLYQGAEGAPARVFGAVDYRHAYISFASLPVTPQNLYPYNVPGVGFRGSITRPPWQTYIGALGIDFANGTLDGEGAPKLAIDAFRLVTGINTDPPTAKFSFYHYPKDVALTTGTTAIDGMTWTPQVIPISILRIGNLAILSVPGEFTSMAASRLRKTVESILGPDTHAVIAGLANDYSGYVTTYEEYEFQGLGSTGLFEQGYEAASTQFGAFTLAGYQTKFTELALALVSGEEVPTLPMPRTSPPISPLLKAADPILDLPPLPQTRAAEYKGKAGCPDGQFFDLLTGSCWSCPDGYNRTIFPIDGKSACEKPAYSLFSSATKNGQAGCAPGQFFDLLTGACWTCPDGYNRTIFPVNGDSACERPAKTINSYATKNDKPGCGPGQFYDLFTAACWSCPDGYERTLFPVTGGTACERSAYSVYSGADSTSAVGVECPRGYSLDVTLWRCYRCPDGYSKRLFRTWNDGAACERSFPADDTSATRHGNDTLCPSGQFLDIGTGYCWSCPSGYNRTIFPIGDSTACELVIPSVLASATRYDGLCPSGQFLDIGTGYCWSCPSDYNRTIWPIGLSTACEKVIPAVSASATQFGKYYCSDRGSDWFLDIGRNECWSCNGWLRNLNPVNGPDACTGPLIGFGDLVMDPLWLRPDNQRVYSRGQRATVAVSFWGGHPKNVFGTIENRKVDALPTFLEVQRFDGSMWQTVRTDADWDTTFEWTRVGVAASSLKLTWVLGPNAQVGTYRIKHSGFSLDGLRNVNSYQGISPTFTVIP
jgi:neutral ceramidase